MTDTSIYDPNSNPRDLRAVPTPEELDAHDQRLARIEHEIQQLNPQIAMFRSRGWTLVRERLGVQLDNALQVLMSNDVTSMEGVAYIRGQIHAFHYLMSLGEAAKQQQQLAKQMLHDARAAVEE